MTTAVGGTANAQQQSLAPIPDMYVGNWGHHGASISISRSDFAPEQGEALMRWRTYSWCQDPSTNNTSPPPCDTILGNSIAAGGLGSITLTHPVGQDDKQLSGVVTATTDPSGTGKWGSSVDFTMLPGNMLLMESGGTSTMFCGENTDLSLYPPSVCGA